MIQLYGQFDGYYSHAQVSRGILQGLCENGVNDLVVHNLGTGGFAEAGDFSYQCARSVFADVSLYIGGYPPFSIAYMGAHRFRAALFICESEVVPREWGSIADKFDLLCFPSEWTRQAYIKAGAPAERSIVVHHGLHPVFEKRITHGDYMGQSLFVHVAGAASFLDRKGTPQLVEAFKRVFGASRAARLLLRCAATPQTERFLVDGLIDLHEPDNSWGALEPEKMRQLYMQADCVIQPSRAEAFGMVPMEARAMGLPVMLTDSSGHLEHFEGASDVCIPTGPSAPISVNGIPSGMAPTVKVEDIEEALRIWPNVARCNGGAEYYDRWRWSSVTRELAAALRDA